MLLIHDLNQDDERKIKPFLPKDTKIFSKEINNIRGCMGCFKCWTKTPGKCIIHDSYTEMPKYILKSGTFLVITKIKYGCYTSYVKNVIDRSIGILLPFFRYVNGEMHHCPRYDNESIKLVVIGYGEDTTPDEEQTFKELIKGNAVNLCISDYEVHTAKNISEINSIIKNL